LRLREPDDSIRHGIALPPPKKINSISRGASSLLVPTEGQKVPGVKIVFLPFDSTESAATGSGEAAALGQLEPKAINRTRRKPTKELRGLLRDAISDRAVVTFYGVRKLAEILERGPAEVSALGDLGSDPKVDAIEFRALGALAVRGLEESEVHKLEIRGCSVIDDRFIGVPIPVDEAPAEFTSASVSNAIPQSARARSPELAGWVLNEAGATGRRRGPRDGAGAIVGILDTGIDGSHPAFKKSKIVYRDFSAANRKAVAHDYAWHGTHVAGLVAQFAPGATLAVAAVLTTPTKNGGVVGPISRVLDGLNWLLSGGDGLERHVDVVNVSLGIMGHHPDLSFFREVSRLGAVAVAAIGNNGEKGIGHHSSPGNYAGVIGVGAYDKDKRVAAFSDWGAVSQEGNIQKPDLVGPGVHVVSAAPGGKYRVASGTSMAAPIVAAAIAVRIGSANSGDTVANATQQVLQLVTPANPADVARAGAGLLDIAQI